LVLPQVETMTPELLRKIESLLQAGATIMGPAPNRSPSLAGYPRCDREVQRRAMRIWGDMELGGSRKLGAGRVVATSSTGSVPSTPPGLAGHGGLPELYGDYAQVASLLRQMGVPPDFESDRPLRCIHRRLGELDLYFVSSSSKEKVEARCVFRVQSKAAELWDPMTGRIMRPERMNSVGQQTELSLSLEPHGSVFVVFRPSPASGRPTKPLHPALQPSLAIEGPWSVRFQANRGAPEQATFERLVTWNEHTDPGVKFFSGTATYRTVFQFEPSRLPNLNGRVFLDLGEVQVMAEATLNGRKVGTAWSAPYRLDVTAAVKPGENQLEITVANLWPNRMIGDCQPASEGSPSRITFSTFQPFKPETALLRSGLLGPVHLMVSE
jgi:hypothetical protein